MPTRIVPRDINHHDQLTDAITAIEKGRGRIIQILEHGQSWVIVYETATRAAKVETR